MNLPVLRKRTVLLIDFAVVLIIIFLYIERDSILSLFPGCFFHGLTNFYCISCGGTRALKAMLDLNIGDALRENFFLVLLGFVILSGWISYNMWVIFNAKIGKKMVCLLSSLKTIIIFLILAGIFGIIRNIPYYPFILLAPV
jgi:hypothetical protein